MNRFLVTLFAASVLSGAAYAQASMTPDPPAPVPACPSITEVVTVYTAINVQIARATNQLSRLPEGSARAELLKFQIAGLFAQEAYEVSACGTQPTVPKIPVCSAPVSALPNSNMSFAETVVKPAMLKISADLAALDNLPSGAPTSLISQDLTALGADLPATIGTIKSCL